MAYLRLENINKYFGDTPALRDVSLEITEGTFCVFLGPSGCGKSTLLNIIAGLEAPSSGRVYLRDRDITGLAPHRRDIAMVFQDYALYPHLNVYENMAFGLRVKKMKKEEMGRRIRDVSRVLNIEDKLGQYPRQLSGGERQRVATGRAIVRDPNLFLFDEPLSNLDARLRLELRKEFLQLQQRLKKTSLYVTHDQTEALSLGDVIVVLREGKIQQVSSPHVLYNEPENLFVAEFVGTPPMNIVEMTLEQHEGRLRLRRGDFSFQATDDLARKFKDNDRDTVFFGIRPSAIRLQDGESGEPYVFDGRVQIVEMLGDDVLADIRLAEEVELRAVFGHGEWHERDEGIRISFDAAKMYFFGKDGSRL